MVLFKYIAAKNFLLAKKFTFQYGSIQISSHKNKTRGVQIYIPIWFYSNKENKQKTEYIDYLHSNMVLFKFI